MATIKLSNKFSMPAVDYAGQGNAVLGIRDAGKTYTAMKAAEELLDAKIPIICYDPVGVWKNLKVGTGKHKGYSVVVAGGEGADIRLNEINAAQIVRAAMKENVSLVIDLYSPELINKSKWIRIVQETVDLLMYENKECGLRHIFIEEAAEFIPQRLQPQHSKVYASLERLARMGRNARLGYTLINQRAEEINKAILEISAMSLLHKQVGKNSLASIQKWLDLLQVENAKQILQSLPTLTQGECWVIGQSTKPQLIQVAERKTFHPDPKKNVAAGEVSKMRVDVTSFVEKLNQQLTKPAPAKQTNHAVSSLSPKDVNQLTKLQEKVAELETRVSVLTQQSAVKDSQIKKLVGYIKSYDSLIKGIRDRIEKDTPVIVLSQTDLPSPAAMVASFHKEERHAAPNLSNIPGNLGKCPKAILAFLASYPARSWSKAQVGIATGYSPNSGGFNNAKSELTTKGLIVSEGGRLKVNQENHELWTLLGPDFKPLQYSIHTFKDKLGKCEREIYEVLLSQPQNIFTKQNLADETQSRYSANSGGFNNALSTLHTLELIKRESGTIRLNPELLELQ